MWLTKREAYQISHYIRDKHIGLCIKETTDRVLTPIYSQSNDTSYRQILRGLEAKRLLILHRSEIWQAPGQLVTSLSINRAIDTFINRISWLRYFPRCCRKFAYCSMDNDAAQSLSRWWIYINVYKLWPTYAYIYRVMRVPVNPIYELFMGSPYHSQSHLCTVRFPSISLRWLPH